MKFTADGKFISDFGHRGPRLSPEETAKQKEDNQQTSLLLRGQAFHRAGEREKAGRSLQAALDIYRQVGDEVGESNARFRLGEWYEAEGQLDRALEHFRAGQAIDNRHDDRQSAGWHAGNRHGSPNLYLSGSRQHRNGPQRAIRRPRLSGGLRAEIGRAHV